MDKKNSKYYLTIETSFDAAHRLSNYEGKCKRIHGHTYKIFVKISSEELLHWGAVIDFGDLKKVIKDSIHEKYDHKLLFMLNDPINNKIANTIDNSWIVWMDKNTTAENIAFDIYQKLKTLLNTVKLEEVTIFETPTNSAIYSEYVN